MNFLFLKLIFVAHLVFGALWLLYPKQMLEYNTVEMKYDTVHTHMTQTFGLTLILVSAFSYYAINTKNRTFAKFCLMAYIIYSCILLVLQHRINKIENSYWDKEKHFKFGMVGLSSSIICCLLGLVM